MRILAALLLLTAPATALRAQQATLQTIVLRPGLVITRSARVVTRTYRLAAPASLDSALIIIRGSNIRVDFANAPVIGAPEDSAPDLARGVAIRVEGGSNVRLTGLNVRGYQVAVLARGTRNLTIENSDVSYNWKPRLFSLVEHESLADWLSFHHNEKAEWLRFGAAIYLDSVTGGTIRNVRAVQGMNALLLNRSSGLRIEHNDFSFNSGLGIGLYRSSDNIIAYNSIDYDVRGYSRFYHRGQDSAGILSFEQSSRNIFAWNSATHGGDGFFLWAGQSTMDSGTGGCNDNFLYANDFSYAPANGIEVTFSRNTIVWNRLVGSDYGIWGGYSYETRIQSNIFENNRTGIAIEHGQADSILGNHFTGDTVAVSLWANPIEPSDWGYPRHHDTRSRDNVVELNSYAGNRVALRLRQSQGTTYSHNTLVRVDSALDARDTTAFSSAGNRVSDGSADRMLQVMEHDARRADSLGGPRQRPVSAVAARDRSAIIVDEWGPYDWQSPRLWPLDSTRAVPQRLAVLGPAGQWRVIEQRGIARVSATTGATGDTVTVTPAPDSAGDWELVLEYRGEATVSPRGARHARGEPVRFSYGRFEPRAEWQVRYFAWTDSATSPTARPQSFSALLRGTPLLTRTEPRLDYMWYRPAIRELPQERFALEATASVTLSPGDHTLRTISDDGVRVWVDGALVIDNWTSHESAVDNAPLAAGRHDLRVQYYQKDGWVELRLEIVRGTERSTGSPGPH